ncbi:unnamed protein product [Strongylus vulgaris]|uniref:Uncharacterized protein n=1 Tax=Strongylus vulgaris TaxID=40348 RepID=A0A3P7JI77_STRVU|nr:unnamed protein product [Strongylus vulgaris]
MVVNKEEVRDRKVDMKIEIADVKAISVDLIAMTSS